MAPVTTPWAGDVPLKKGTSFEQRTFDLSAYKGQTVRIYFGGIGGSTVQSSSVIDEVTLTTL